MPAERDQLFEQLFEASSEPAYIVDPREDRVLAANQAGCAMLGYTHEELLATPVSHIHPAELPQLSEFLDRVLRDGQGSTIKLTCRTKQGEFLPTQPGPSSRGRCARAAAATEAAERWTSSTPSLASGAGSTTTSPSCAGGPSG